MFKEYIFKKLSMSAHVVFTKMGIIVYKMFHNYFTHFLTCFQSVHILWLYVFFDNSMVFHYRLYHNLYRTIKLFPIFIKNAEKYVLYIHLPLIFIPLIGFWSGIYLSAYRKSLTVVLCQDVILAMYKFASTRLKVIYQVV